MLDDGGRAIELTPKDFYSDFLMSAIEQTRGGLYSKTVQSLVCPLIPVGSSAIKKLFLEPLMIVTAILRTKQVISTLTLASSTVCGVIGHGSIGKALVEYLLNKGHRVYVFDPEELAFADIKTQSSKLIRADSIDTVLAHAHYIFGCTGQDITRGIDILGSLTHDITFINTACEQSEFYSLIDELTQISNQTSPQQSNFNPLGNLIYYNRYGRTITVKNMGYPFNFPILAPERHWLNPWNVPAPHIEMTQCAMFGAAIQGILQASKPIADGVTINRPRAFCLDPYLQRFIAFNWGMREYRHFKERYPQVKFDRFNNINWIIKNSGAEHRENSVIRECFEHFLKPTFTEEVHVDSAPQTITPRL